LALGTWHVVLNIRTLHQWKSPKFDMPPLSVGGTPLELLAKVELWNLTIG
jgi:hypothetical protein